MSQPVDWETLIPSVNPIREATLNDQPFSWNQPFVLRGFTRNSSFFDKSTSTSVFDYLYKVEHYFQSTNLEFYTSEADPALLHNPRDFKKQSMPLRELDRIFNTESCRHIHNGSTASDVRDALLSFGLYQEARLLYCHGIDGKLLCASDAKTLSSLVPLKLPAASKVIELVQTPKRALLYIYNSHSIKDMLEQKVFPDVFSQLRSSDTMTTASLGGNVWALQAGTTHIGPHFDDGWNVMHVVSGEKQILLFPPDQMRNMYVTFLGSQQGIPCSEVRLGHGTDISKYPRLMEAFKSAQVVTLKAGDSVVWPPYWWHHVKTTGPSFSMNCWYVDTSRVFFLPKLRSIVKHFAHQKLSDHSKQFIMEFIKTFVIKSYGPLSSDFRLPSSSSEVADVLEHHNLIDDAARVLANGLTTPDLLRMSDDEMRKLGFSESFRKEKQTLLE